MPRSLRNISIPLSLNPHPDFHLGALFLDHDALRDCLTPVNPESPSSPPLSPTPLAAGMHNSEWRFLFCKVQLSLYKENRSHEADL